MKSYDPQRKDRNWSPTVAMRSWTNKFARTVEDAAYLAVGIHTFDVVYDAYLGDDEWARMDELELSALGTDRHARY